MNGIDTPHFDLPFTLTPLGAVVVDQGALDDIVNCVLVAVQTHVGERDLAPDFGVPDPVFRLSPAGADRIAALISAQEPRAALSVVENLDPKDQLIDHIQVKIATVRGNS